MDEYGSIGILIVLDLNYTFEICIWRRNWIPIQIIDLDQRVLFRLNFEFFFHFVSRWIGKALRFLDKNYNVQITDQFQSLYKCRVYSQLNHQIMNLNRYDNPLTDQKKLTQKLNTCYSIKYQLERDSLFWSLFSDLSHLRFVQIYGYFKPTIFSELFQNDNMI